MPGNSPRRGRTREADVYWRRRFLALVTVLGVTALLTWAFSGLFDHGTPRRSSGVSRAAAYGGTAAGVSHGTDAPFTTSPSASPSTSRTAGTSVGRRPTASARPGTSPATPSASAGPLSTCPVRDVVLSLFTDARGDGAQQTTVFQVDVVSTAATTCTFNEGPAALRVTVSSPTGVVWNSAACLDGPRPRVVTLRRGVPSVVFITWNRRISADGCGKGQPLARSGSYRAVASSGTVTSQAAVFQLR